MVATSAALLQKVATRSPKWEGAAAAHARAEALRLHSEELVEQDSVAYLAYVEAVRSGKDEEAARGRTIEIPLGIVRVAAEVVELAGQLAVHGNRNLHADAVIAAILANAAAESAALLVAVNVEDADDPRLDEASELAERSDAGKDSLR